MAENRNFVQNLIDGARGRRFERQVQALAAKQESIGFSHEAAVLASRRLCGYMHRKLTEAGIKGFGL